MDPEIERKVLEIFNDIWYDYDEENGQINMARYVQILKFAQKFKKIPPFKNQDEDPFSEKNLEAAFKREDETSYGEKDKIDGKISHKSVMYIAHDIFQVVYADRKKRLARKADLK